MINNSNFLLKDVPNYHPLFDSYERKIFWKQERRKCIEGDWSLGKWCPGPLYYYVNFHHIKMQTGKSASQGVSLPSFRDLEWELFYYYEECRGFSGFSGDKEHTCDRKYGPESQTALALERITQKEIDSKKYIPAREYLRKIHHTSLGKPLYKNEAKHFMSIQSRGSGKTYSSSAIGSHNFLFGGATDYDVYLEMKKLKKPLASDTILGAIDTKYSEALVKNVKLAFEYFAGSFDLEDAKYPSPLLPIFTGSLASNKEYRTAAGSYLRHRTFKDNPTAGNGTRANIAILDEVGFMYNLQESWGALEAIQASELTKNLVIWALGTGGLVSGKAALYAEAIFRNPTAYNCIAFDDEFENRGEIGCFVPYWKTMNEFKKGPNLISDEPLARKAIELRRSIAKKGNDPRAYQTEIINGPIVPSEAFLVLEGSYFPILLLKEQLAEVEGGLCAKYLEGSFKGVLRFDKENQVEFETIQDLQPIRDFPLDRNNTKSGCVEIWVKPQKNDAGVVPYGIYIAGMDVVDKAKSTTDSLPSIFVMNRFTRQIVAEYTGRTDDPNDFYEQCRKLLLYYNATGMYEQNLPGLFTYFERHRCTYLLADTPPQLRNADTFKEGSNTSKGINAATKVNSTARDFIKSWLLEHISENSETRVYQTLYSPALIKELIMWNPDGNFDRCVIKGSKVLTNKGLQEIETLKKGDFVISKNGQENKIYETHISEYNDNLFNLRSVGNHKGLPCTKNHPIFVKTVTKKHTQRVSPFHEFTLSETNIIRADEVTKNHLLLTPIRKNRKNIKLSDDLKYLLGWILGDGYICNRDKNTTYNVKIYFQGDQLNICKKIKTIIINNFSIIYYSNRNKKLNLSCNIVKEGNMYKLIIFSKPFFEFCSKYLGVSPNKQMSPELFNSTNMIPFLQGYFEADGHYELNPIYNRNVLSVTTVTETESYQIRQLLLDEGIWCTSSKSKSYKLTNGYIRKDAYTISINNVGANLIIKNSLKFKSKGFISINKKGNYFKTEEGYWTKVSKIETFNHKDKVYNISVENDPSYTANGLCTHNCSALGMLMWHDATTTIISKKMVETTKTFLEHDYWKNMGVLKNTPIITDNSKF